MLERLTTHLPGVALHVCWLEGLPLLEFACVVGLDVVVVEGVGGPGVAGMLEVVEGVEVLGGILDGTFGCPPKLLLL